MTVNLLDQFYYPCLFCGTHNRIEMYHCKCETCHVAYDVNHKDIREKDFSWILTGVTYKLNDPVYHSVVIYLESETTFLWFAPAGPGMKHIKIPRAMSIVHPSQALELAKRIDHLKVFS